MAPSDSCAAIILAAGSSSRMGAGRHKLLLPLGNQPVVQVVWVQDAINYFYH